jgi:hypothetical protein
MSLRDVMLKDLERGLAIVRDGHEIVPAWRIFTPEDDFVILTRYDPDKPDQREQMMQLVPRFIAWRLATAFVMTAETWLGPERTRSGEEAVMAIGVSHRERLGVIRRKPVTSSGPPEWIAADAIDEGYSRMLPTGQTTVTEEEAAMLKAIFSEYGELPARPASASVNGLRPISKPS